MLKVLFNRMKVIAAVAAVALLMAYASLVPAVLPIVTSLLLLVFFVLYTRLDLGSMMCVYFASDIMCNFFKRVVFLVMPDLFSYYLITALPALVLFAMLGVWISRPEHRSMPAGGLLLIVFTGLASVLTLLSEGVGGYIPVRFRLMAVNGLSVASLYFIASTMRSRQLAKASGFVVFIVISSAAYGLWQFLFGPTPVEKVWANYMAGRSVVATVVWVSVNLGLDTFRPMSFYASSFYWGLFLNAAPGFLALSAAGRHRISRMLQMTFWTCLFGGLFLSLTRSSWVALFSTFLFLALLKRDIIRSARTAGMLLAMILVLSLWVFHVLPDDDPAIRDVQDIAGEVGARYATSGTLKDRAITMDVLEEALRKHWLIGTGFARSELFEPSSRLDAVRMHSSVISMLAGVGIAGSFLFLAFFFSVSRKVIQGLKRCADPAAANQIRWLFACVCGYFVIGYSVGPAFLNNYFFFFLGACIGLIRDNAERQAVLARPQGP